MQCADAMVVRVYIMLMPLTVLVHIKLVAPIIRNGGQAHGKIVVKIPNNMCVLDGYQGQGVERTAGYLLSSIGGRY